MLKKLIAHQIRQNAKYSIFGALTGDAFNDPIPKEPPAKPERTVVEKAPEMDAESASFVGRIRKICRESLEAGLLLVEKYYSVKGNSPNTRPKLIHKTPELAADALLTKLQSYFNQSTSYLKKSTSEFREQMSRLEVLCSLLAKLFFDVLYGRLQRKCEMALEAINTEFTAQLKQFDLQREQNYSQLHPKLSLPQYASTELNDLNSKEERRRQNTEELLISTLRRKADVLQDACHEFAKKAPVLLESLLLRFDSLVCSNEIQDDDVQQNSEQDDSSNPTVERYQGKRTLPVIDWTEFFKGLRVPSRLQTVVQAPVRQSISSRTSVTQGRSKQFQQKPPEDRTVRYRFSCGKNTEAHAVAIECMRDKMQKFLHYLQTEMQSAEMACEDGFRRNKSWSEEWKMNQQLILDLNPLRRNQTMPNKP